MSDSGAILNAQFHGGRLLLPRQEPPPPPPQVTKRTRATKACTSCRNRKTKCTGELPRCFECKTCDLDCAYEQGRRDRLKDVLEHKRLLVALLKDLRQNVYADQRKMIEDALDAVSFSSSYRIHL
ncbi:hypothetical protein P153DRAFT_208978 [Dothidotthia symphoricarpi CBS 119687]|uniref:Zn(2)-C6 fungal-type domain-containing protein n=1 Tax=Dothidotthia symphoricarpi CBS 119687 TaxID=1392245 RepID=A0A6A6AJD5_9PLEO|nr:uncharacterized protein P153DRAFT_208978 [Dothidotthia symphoricarpi CBS 119687]KAF2131024.1 hypothetical protein P153DRAFT_208978 [Dothidotthia symphoricarpi CBS 119687]